MGLPPQPMPGVSKAPWRGSRTTPPAYSAIPRFLIEKDRMGILVLRNQRTSPAQEHPVKIPFSPSVYEHAARWVERSPWDVSRDPDLLFSGHHRAYLEYRHSPIVVGIDIYNLEAEAYGDTILILDDLLSTGTGFLVCNVETDQQTFINRAGATHPQVKIRVNMDPGIVAGADTEAIYREIDRILALTADHPNCLMGTGCLPLETPPENVRLIREYVA